MFAFSSCRPKLSPEAVGKPCDVNLALGVPWSWSVPGPLLKAQTPAGTTGPGGRCWALGGGAKGTLGVNLLLSLYKVDGPPLHVLPCEVLWATGPN